MSYINDALKKAQNERDSHYQRFGGVIADHHHGPTHARKRRLAIGAAVMLFILIPAGVLLAVHLLQQPLSGTGKDAGPSMVESAKTETDVKTAAENTVPEAKQARTSPEGKNAAGPSAQKDIPSGTGTVSNGPPVRNEAEVRYQEALSAHQRGNIVGAESLYREVLALQPGHVYALNNLGVICLLQKNREKAIALFGKAIVLDKKYVDPYYNLACVFAGMNEIDESLWYLKAAMTINADVQNWARKDADMKNVVASPAFKRLMKEK